MFFLVLLHFMLSYSATAAAQGTNKNENEATAFLVQYDLGLANLKGKTELAWWDYETNINDANSAVAEKISMKVV